MNSTLQSCPQGFHPSPSPTRPPRSALTAFPTLLRILGSISSITHKSCCSHSTSRLSTVHNSQLVRKTRVNYLTILVARATALFFCLFASSVPGKTPRQCSGWWSSQYNDQTSKINSGCAGATTKFITAQHKGICNNFCISPVHYGLKGIIWKWQSEKFMGVSKTEARKSEGTEIIQG